MFKKARFVLPFLFAPTLYAVAHATPPPLPAGLSPAGQEWVKEYEVLDHKVIGFCFYMKRRYSPPPGITGTLLSEPCQHLIPPTNANAVSTRRLPEPLPAFTSLPLSDQTVLRPWLLATLNTPVDAEETYSDFDIRRDPGFIPDENRIATSNSQMTVYATKQEARNRQIEQNATQPASPQSGGLPLFPIIILLAALGGAYYAYTKRKAASDKPSPSASAGHKAILGWLLGSYSGNLAIIFVVGAFLGLGFETSDRLTAAFLFGLIAAFIGLLPLWFARELVRTGYLNSVKGAARRAGYTPRKWPNPYIDGWWLRLILAQAPANYTLEFTDARLLKERAAMPRFRLMWNRNHHQREQQDIGWMWAETFDGNPTVGNPPPEEMRTFLQWPRKVKGKHRLTLWEITPGTAANLNNGPLHEGKIPVREYPSGEVMELEHWIGNMEGRAWRREETPSGGGGTAKPVGLREPPQEPTADPTPRSEDGDKL